jgi:hypothetical protein
MVALALILAAVVATSLFGIVRSDPRQRREPGHNQGIAAADAPLSWLQNEHERRAFREFRPELRAGSRFAVIVGRGSNASIIRPLALYYFYPAIGVSSPALADYVVTVGRVPAPPGFIEVIQSNGAWLGVRSR